MAIRCGDCLHVMSRCMEENSVDAVVTDPPYNLITLSRNGSPRQPGTGPFGRHREGNVGGFMGKHWDGTGIAFDVETWATVLRILKPSHYLLTFGGTRTWHRLACAIEDAGFEIRDTLMWLYGSGFPKGTACLKPSWEPIILARKPGPKRALGIEECRIATDERLQGSTVRNDMRGGHYGAGHRPATDVPMYEQSPLGRYPANLILNEEAARLLDEQTRTSSPGGASRFFYCAKASRAERNAGLDSCEIITIEWSSWEGEDQRVQLLVDTAPSPPRVIAGYGIQPSDATVWSMFLFGSGISVQSLRGCRFTIETKTNSTMQSATLSWLTRLITNEDIAGASTETENGGSHAVSAETGTPCLTITSAQTVSPPGAGPVASPTRLRISGGVAASSDHPTVKPIALMRWLVRLVARESEVVLDPFMGSGGTGVACVFEGRQFLGIEKEAGYVEIARRRIAHARLNKAAAP